MARKNIQLEFDGRGFGRTRDHFGGDHLKNSHPKSRRPLSSKHPIHLVVRSEKARGSLSFLHPGQFRKVNRLVREFSRKHGIRIHDYANSGNHLHAVLRLRTVSGWPAFIRALTGRLAQAVQGLRARQSAVSFFDKRPFTRVVAGWGRAYQVVREYLAKNRFEAEGPEPYKQDFDSA